MCAGRRRSAPRLSSSQIPNPSQRGPPIRAEQILKQAVGPAPWYWQTFPEISGASGRRFVWNYHGEQGPIGYLVTLHPRQDPGATVLALNTYCRAFAIGASRLGVWCPEAAAAVAGQPYIRLLCFDPETLESFPLEDVAGWFKQSNERVYSATAPVAEFEISSGLGAGEHALAVPEEFRKAGELLIVSPLPAASKNDPACAIVVLDARSGRAQVLPQGWFTAAQFDTGYQWITRVARDPMTGRMVGEGIRMKRFELAEDGCTLERWLE